MAEADPSRPRSLALRGTAPPIELDDAGFRHPRSPRFGGSDYTLYADVTHVAAGAGGVRIGTRRGSHLLRRERFAAPGGHQELARELRLRIARGPRGFEQMERMARLDGLAARPGGTPVAGALALLCVLGFLVAGAFPAFEESGLFSALRVRLGEPWRLVTANFLHASPLHLALNGAGLLALGALAERSLGSSALLFVAALSGLGAMLASLAAGYDHALGASGLVYGMTGALLWLEHRTPEALPVSWRLPRRLFLGLLALESALLLGVPGIAHAAHAGGFAAGALGAAALGPRLEAALRPRRALALANVLALAAGGLAGAAWARSALAPDPGALARVGEVLLARPDVPPLLLNNEAWRIATSAAPGPHALEVAERLAERAAQETGYAAPVVLDTLAEVQFRAGRSERALALADAAIALAPDEPYYREQRRRFAGERAADDRPPDPELAPPAPRPFRRRSPEPGDGPGLRV